MKKILLLSGGITLLATTGCLVSEGGRHSHYHGHARYESRSAVVVGPPVVVVPAVVVRPPVIIVR